MNELKYTDGPWEVDNSRHGEGYGITHIKVNDGSEICVAWKSALVDEDRFDANCNLIAAAPDLYEALSLLVSRMASCKAGYSEAMAALAKARGE